MLYKWTASPKLNDKNVESLATELNIPNSISQLLLQRGIDTFDKAKKFFRPTLNDLHDPFLMKGMEKAVIRIQEALTNNEKIVVYGDYDVDGTTSVALVYMFLTELCKAENVEYYIPDRYKEGYGISKIGIDYAHQVGTKLIIALDCGTRSVELVKYAKSLGIDFIICDHHLPGDTLPECVALLNPKQEYCEYPYKELSGCGIGFKLVQAYQQFLNLPFEDITRFLDIVAVSTCSDIVEMKDENRVFVYYGIKKMNENPSIAIQAMLSGYQLKNNYDVNDIVFGIGPRINAAGRIGDAKLSVKLLIEKDFHKAKSLTKLLEENNDVRKGFDSDITKEALEKLSNNSFYETRKSTVLFSETWHKGVIGIVASRLIENYYKPTIIFSEVNGMLTGSARSIKDFDIHEAIGECGNIVIQYGGHKYAAGLTIKKEDFELFSETFDKIVIKNSSPEMFIPQIFYDIELDLKDITDKFYNLLEQFKPHGPGNMSPIFRTNHLINASNTRIVKAKHIKFEVSQNNYKMDGIGFGLGNYFNLVENNKKFDSCYSIEMNEFNGRKSKQLKIRDINPSTP